MAIVYMTVSGRSIDTTKAIRTSRARLGVESSNSFLIRPKFVDYPFTDPDATFTKHLNVVRQVKPEIAVAPDIEKGLSLDAAISQADKLLMHANTVVIVPKSVHPEYVPSRFRVGVPLADFGSGAPWAVWDYRNVGPVHLLGGGAARQIQTGKHLDVASVDTATMGKVARFGYWDGVSKDAPDQWDYRTRLRESLNNYADEWSS